MPKYQVMPPTLNPQLFNAAGDEIDYTNYDRMQLNNAGGAVEREFFVIGVGQEDPISAVRKTKADTNVRGGRIAEGQAMGVFALKFYYENGAVKTEAQKILKDLWIHGTYIEFLIESKNEYGIWKLSELLGFVDDAQVTASATGQASNASQGEYFGIKQLNYYIPLPRLCSYSVNMVQTVVPDASQDADYLNCALVGIKNRAG